MVGDGPPRDDVVLHGVQAKATRVRRSLDQVEDGSDKCSRR